MDRFVGAQEDMERGRGRSAGSWARRTGGRMAFVAAVGALALVGANQASAAPPRPAVSIVAPATFTAGTPSVVRIRVTNRTARPMRNVRVSLQAPGAVVRLAGNRTWTRVTLRARGARTLVARVTPPATARPLVFTARAGAARAVKRARVVETLSGRYFWGNTYTVMGIRSFAMYFVDNRWVYRGFPEGGGLPTCTTQTAVDDGDGCLPYTYNPVTRALTIGGEPATFTDTGTIEYDSYNYIEAKIPDAGTVLAGGGTDVWQTGLCPGITCSFGRSDMTFTADGQFGVTGYVSGGDLMTGGIFTVLPPDKRGTYQVTARGTIVLTYADGTVRTRTIAVMTNDAGVADATEGVILDDSPYVAITK